MTFIELVTVQLHVCVYVCDIRPGGHVLIVVFIADVSLEKYTCLFWIEHLGRRR